MFKLEDIKKDEEGKILLNNKRTSLCSHAGNILRVRA
jgi:hypothetical protein